MSCYHKHCYIVNLVYIILLNIESEYMYTLSI